MKKVNRKLLALPLLLASLTVGFNLVSCKDNTDEPENAVSDTDPAVSGDKNSTSAQKGETKPAKNPSATTESFKGAFVVGKDSYTTLNIMSDKTYEMTDSLVKGTEDDWGTWELIEEASSARANALAKSQKNYRFTSKAHKTTDGKNGTFEVETSSAGAGIKADTDATEKLEVSGVGLDTEETIYKTERPVTIEHNTLNLTEEEIKNVFTLEAIEKGGANKGVKIIYKSPSSRTERKPFLTKNMAMMQTTLRT